MSSAFEPADLLGDGAVERRVAGMHPRDVLAAFMRRRHLGDDLVERQRRRVDDPRTLGRGLDDLRGHQRAGIEADRAALDQAQAAHGDQVGRAGTGADEMHGHAALSFRGLSAMPVPAFPA